MRVCDSVFKPLRFIHACPSYRIAKQEKRKMPGIISFSLRSGGRGREGNPVPASSRRMVGGRWLRLTFFKISIVPHKMKTLR